MAITWKIEQLIVKPTDGSYTDVVITAVWRCSGQEDVSGTTHYGTCYGTASFAGPGNPFTEYDDLTESEVLDWCYAAGVDKTAIETNVTDQINRSKNPPTVSLPLPWIN